MIISTLEQKMYNRIRRISIGWGSALVAVLYRVIKGRSEYEQLGGRCLEWRMESRVG